MSDYVSLGVVLLSALAYASLQLNLGCLLLLYHSSVGKHITKKTRSLVSSYIFGISIFLLIALAAAGFYILLLEKGSLELWLISSICGALVALSILIWTIYYRFGSATELWLPRSITNFLRSRSKTTNNPVESFSLGLMACFAELPFSIILIILSANSILAFNPILQFVMICLFIIISILPLIILRISLRKGSSVVAVQTWRTKNKLFLRILSGLLFLTLGIFIFVFEVMGRI